ncbi:hypothetical protein A2164_03100 [Candidatus Curtissbacteria bacterium RBG_13_35_7]|uniref:Type II secretion system protein GspG C-terminal domain-containing protein n=1 Tax=Candidatus Curtissbacteria bacterium RBG_13_35_7 TaxID=1797705 RepID=A0A1F5G1C3_9BACT|nr:MAG: hypothetical protein A2164_03100 [Candidatus Curtissbacteria bacterium RBG_13_35_7]
MKKFLPKGFTLIELLVVIGILTVLLAIVLIAVNPARQFAQANNTQRRSDVNAILNAVHQYAADNKGKLPTNIATTELTIAAGIANADICADIVDDYIAGMPYDPSATGASYTDCSDYDTKYTILQNANKRVTVKAPGAQDEGGTSVTISVTR